LGCLPILRLGNDLSAIRAIQLQASFQVVNHEDMDIDPTSTPELEISIYINSAQEELIGIELDTQQPIPHKLLACR
jgi:hypothetical protein